MILTMLRLHACDLAIRLADAYDLGVGEAQDLVDLIVNEFPTQAKED